MSTLILKFILCSSALYGVYHFILRREKSLKFNRFFLLSILGCAMVFPTIITQTEYMTIPVQENSYVEWGQFTPQSEITSIPVKTPEISISTTDLLWTFYALISLFFVVRFIRNLWQIQQLKKGGQLISQNGLDFCLRDDIKSSFTFLNTIYLNKEAFERKNIPQEIIEHEAVHAKQKHSIDIILIEAAQCLLWFNPVLYLIKSAIKMNHEYLADAKVCEHIEEISRYQKTLIQYVYNSKQQPVLASQLTFGQTKNRLNMMVKNLQLKSATWRIMLTLLATVGALYGFGQKQVIAQEKRTEDQSFSTSKDIQDIRNKLTVISLLRADQKVKYLDADGNWVEQYYGELSKEAQQRFRKKEAKGQFYIEALPAQIPSDQLMQDFLNEKKYGVWIDDNRVENAFLKNFNQKDFHHYTISKLHPGAKDYGVHDYQVDLVTWKTYEEQPYSKGGWRLYHDAVKEIDRALNALDQSKKKDLPPPPTVERQENIPLPHPPSVKMSSVSEKDPLVRLKHEGTFYILEFKVFQEINPNDIKDIRAIKDPETLIKNNAANRPGILEIELKKNERTDKLIKRVTASGFKITVTDITKRTISLSCEGCAWRTLEFGSKVGPTHTIDFYGVTDSRYYDENDSQFAFRLKRSKKNLALSSLKGTAWEQLEFNYAKPHKATIDYHGIRTE